MASTAWACADCDFATSVASFLSESVCRCLSSLSFASRSPVVPFNLRELLLAFGSLRIPSSALLLFCRHRLPASRVSKKPANADRRNTRKRINWSRFRTAKHPLQGFQTAACHVIKLPAGKTSDPRHLPLYIPNRDSCECSITSALGSLTVMIPSVRNAKSCCVKVLKSVGFLSLETTPTVTRL